MKRKEKVILLHDSKWGKKYETKELRRGFVANYLLPQKKILLVNEKNLAWLEQKKTQKAQAELILEEQTQKNIW